MSWWALELRAGPGQRDAVAAWLVERTGQGVEERDDGTLVTVAQDADLADTISGEATGRFEGIFVTCHPIDPVDWTVRWRDGLGPRRFGRLVVAPTWSQPVDLAEGEVLVTLDPESAFGSGEHGSTRAALSLLERHLSPGDRVLDLGSGSGILAIAAVRLGAASAVGIEVDETALEIAERNAIRNSVDGRVRFITGDAAHLAPLAGPADLLLSNILRTVNITLLPAIRASLRAGGLAIFAGMEAAERGDFLPELAAAGFNTVDETEDGSWWAVAARTG